jgi:hypothetical protein
VCLGSSLVAYLARDPLGNKEHPWRETSQAERPFLPSRDKVANQCDRPGLYSVSRMYSISAELDVITMRRDQEKTIAVDSRPYQRGIS